MNESATPLFFGDWLKRRRQNLDLTQAELAEAAGCSVFALRKIETGERRPSKQLAGLLAAALGIPPEERDVFVRAARGEMAADCLGLAVSPAMTTSPPTPPSSPLHNLPASPTVLVGRETELDTLARLLRDPNCRLLTLIGPGGIGKTRLAIEVAAQQQAHFADGVWFVALASVGLPGAVVPAIADALDFALHGQMEPRLQLMSHLSGRRMLLVLDNLEHLLEGVELFTDLLAHAPGVKILTTSRERLNLQSEWVFVTQGLPVPPPDLLEHARDYDAIKLFDQSARRARADFRLEDGDLADVVRICRLVEGMPLAIELAAAWAPVLGCREIAQEIQHNLDFLTTSLRDLPERQRSLRAAFDHSWRLLTADEQAALGRLAVFQGGFERSAAEQVAETGLITLLNLTSKSLTRRQECGRYDLHEVVRQYAHARLTQTPEFERTRDRHSRFYLALLHNQDVALRSGAQRQALRTLTDEIDNLRSAWAWAIARGKFDVITPAVRSFGCLFELSGWLEEGVDLLESVIRAGRAAPDDPVRDKMLGEALAQQSLLLFRQGRFAPAQERLRASLALLRPFADPDLLVRPLLFHSIILFLDGELDEAQARLEEALACARTIGDRWAEAYADFNLGYLAHLRGNHQAGYTRMCAGLALWRVVGDPRSIALGLNHLCPAAIHLGRYQEAEAFLRESLELYQEAGDRWGMGTALRFLGMVALAKGQAVKAQQLFHQSLDVHQGFVTGWDIARSLIYLGEATLALGDVAAAQGHYSQALIVAEEARSLPLSAEARLGLARVETISALRVW